MDTIICSGKDYKLDVPRIKSDCLVHHFDIAQENINDLLTQNKTHYVQTFGYELRGTHFSSTKMNLMNKHLILSPHFESLKEILGEDVIAMILSNFYVDFFHLKKKKKFWKK